MGQKLGSSGGARNGVFFSRSWKRQGNHPPPNLQQEHSPADTAILATADFGCEVWEVCVVVSC